jgi:hypothetical protein
MIKELILASVLAVYPPGMPSKDYEAMQEMEQDVIECMTPGAVIEIPFDVYEVETVSGPMSEHLTRSGGVFEGPSGTEKYYNLNMSKCVSIMNDLGYSYEYWVRDDGVKMFGEYVMCATDTYVYPKGTILETSLGTAMVVDHCVAAENSFMIDICVTW